MNLFNFLRQRLFWTSDFIKGSPIRKHYNNIKDIHENKANTKETLSLLLNHAASTTPFYKKEVTSKNSYSITDFPVINKDMIRNNYDSFKSSDFLNKKNTTVSTGGSTGTPFKFFHDTNKRHRHLADNIFYAEQGGYNLGDKLYLLRAWHKKSLKSTIVSKMKNMELYGIVNYTNKDVEDLLNTMRNDKTTKCIVCFASMCDVVVDYLDSNKDVPNGNLNIKSIITDGDALSKMTKDKMDAFFKTPTVARYGNMECGIMGQQSYKGGYNYDLNWASYHFEVLNLNDNIEAKPGEVGRIVVTDLFNHCMPLIRYDTGDLASYTTNDKGVKVFERIEGRKVDVIYNTKGDIISPYMVVQKMSEYFELKQFQFVQEGKKQFTFKLNPWDTFTKENELIADSKTYLGSDAEITLEYVTEIPLLSSGKRKQVVNNMK